MLRQPLRGVGGPAIDRVPGHVRRRVGSGDPSSRFLFTSVLGDRLTEELVLVDPGTPATVDVELDVGGSCIGRRLAQGAEQLQVEVGYAGVLVIEHRHAVGEEAVRPGGGAVGPGRRTRVADAEGCAGRGRRRGRRLVAEGRDDRSGNDDEAGGSVPRLRDTTRARTASCFPPSRRPTLTSARCCRPSRRTTR